LIIFDTLSELESYVPALKDLSHVISLLDRSLPYREEPGVHYCPEKRSISYLVDSFMTSTEGYEFTVPENSFAVLVTLDGEQLVSTRENDKVFIMAEGRFLVLSEGVYRKGICSSLPSEVKDAVFSLGK